MNDKTYIKNTPVIWGFGIFFIIFFGWWLIRRYNSYDFSEKFRIISFILDNSELVIAVLMGIGFILLAIFA